jgi:hypothetical protein
LLKQGYKFYYRIVASDKGLSPNISNDPEDGYYCVEYDSAFTLIESNKGQNPERLQISCYPNPFNSQTKICFSLRNREFVSLKVFDALGNEIIELVNEEKMPGFYEIVLDATDLASGVYFSILCAGTKSSSQKILLIK